MPVTAIAVAAAAALGIVFTPNVTKLFQTIIGNLFYLEVFAAVILGGIVLAFLAYKGKIGKSSAIISVILLFGFAFAAPVSGITLGKMTGEWAADITVTVSDPMFGKIDLNNVQSSKVRKTGGMIFSARKACVISCGDWTVKTIVYCKKQEKQKEQEQEQVQQKKITKLLYTGTGSQSVTKTVHGLPAGSTCTAVATLTRTTDKPNSNIGKTIKTKFQTGGGR